MTANVQTLALLVKAAYRAGMREVNAALADLRLAAQAEALAVLAQAGPTVAQPAGRAANRRGWASQPPGRPTVSAGWVARQEAIEDRRRVTLRLTAAGARLHAQAVERTGPVFERLGQRLEGQDLAAACAALAACLKGTDLAEKVSRRLADTADATTTRPTTPPAPATTTPTIQTAPDDPS